MLANSNSRRDGGDFARAVGWRQGTRQSRLSRTMEVSAKRQRGEEGPRRSPKPTYQVYDLDLVEALRKIQELKSLPRDWNGLDSEPPTYTAIARAATVLIALESISLRPERVAASAEGGIGIMFRRGRKFASIEFLNSGETVVLTSDGTGNPRAWEIDTSDKSLGLTAETLREYIEP